MHHHSNKRHAREQYGVQERDSGAWKPPASHFSCPDIDYLTHSMHMTPGLAQRDAFYIPRALAMRRNTQSHMDLVDQDREQDERAKRNHSEIDSQEQLVNDLVEKIELHRIGDEAGTDGIAEHQLYDGFSSRVTERHRSTDYDTAQRCARAAIRINEQNSYETAQRCARSVIAMHGHQSHEPSSSEMRRNAAHAAFRRLKEINMHQ